MDKEKEYTKNMTIIYKLISKMKAPLQRINNMGFLDDASYSINVNMEEMMGELK